MPAEAAALHDEHVETLARPVHGCSQPSGPAADDHEIVEGAVWASLESQLGCQLGIRGLH